METETALHDVTAGPLGRSSRAPALIRRFVLGLAGEGVQSAFHLLVNLVLMRSLTAYGYGLFALVFMAGSLAVTYSNAMVAIPAAVYLPRLRSPGAARFQEVVFGAVATALSAGAGALTLAGLWLWSGSAAFGVSAGCFVASWTLRNSVRAGLFARREPGLAAGADLVFAGTGTACLAAAWRLDGLSLVSCFAILAVANACGALVGLYGPRRPVRLSFRRGVRRRYARLWPQISWSLAGMTTINVQAQFQTVLVALIAGPAAYAPIAAALVLLAPLRLGGSALVLLMQPEFARHLAAGRRGEVRRLLLAGTAATVFACLAYGAVLCLGWDPIDARIFAPAFADQQMGLVTALAWMTALLYIASMLPKAVLEAAGAFRAVAAATLASALAGIVAVAALLAWSGPAWSLAGVVLAESITLVRFGIGAARVTRPRG